MANSTKVQEFKNGQKIVTIPRAIAEALRLEKQDKLEWIFDKGDVIVRKV